MLIFLLLIWFIKTFDSLVGTPGIILGVLAFNASIFVLFYIGIFLVKDLI